MTRVPDARLLRSTLCTGAALALLLALLGLVQAEPNEKATAAKTNTAAVALDEKLIAEGKTNSEIMANLTYLSDVIGPRLTGSANLKRANDWTAEKMRSYGLTNVKLEAWELPVTWERGTAAARIVEPDNGKSLTLAAAGWSPGTNGKVVGDVVVVTARTPEDLKKYEGKLKNAIVLRGAPTNVRPISDMTFSVPGDRPPPGAERPGSPDRPPTAGRPAAAAPDKAQPDKAQPDKAQPDKAQPDKAQPDKTTPDKTTPDKTTPDKPATDKKPDDKPPAKTDPNPPPAQRPAGFDSRPGRDFQRFRREMTEFFRKEGVVALLSDSGKPHGLLNMSGGWGGTDRGTAAEQLPTLFVTHDHYALLHRLATRPAPAKTRLELDVANKLTPGPVAVYNTVGEIRGSEKPDEFVVLGAHLDSWDLGQGTTDNGTGTCVVLEAARILMKSGVKPKRTIRFVLFSGEEQGLHGSKAYVAQHADELPRTSAALIHDTGTGRITAITLQGREVLKPLMEPEVASLAALGVTEVTARSMGGSDHMSFEAKGVPGFMFRQDPAEYRLTHHSQSDTLDKAREPDLVQGAQVMAVMALRIANRDQLLPRDKPAPATTTTTPTTTPAAAEKKPEK